MRRRGRRHGGIGEHRRLLHLQAVRRLVRLGLGGWLGDGRGGLVLGDRLGLGLARLAILVVGLVAAVLGLGVRQAALRGRVDELGGARHVQFLATGGRKLFIALALALARGSGGRRGIGDAAKCVVQGGGRRAAVRDVGHFAQAHQLNGNVLVLFRHAAADSGVWRRQNAHGAAAAIADAAAVMTAVFCARGSIYTGMEAVAIVLRTV